VIRFIPAVLCGLMILVHFILVTNYNGDTWKFGGLRMFSKVSEKILIIDGKATNGVTYQISLKDNLTVYKAQSLPTPYHLKTVLNSIVDNKVIKTAEGFEIVSKNDALLDFKEGFVQAYPSGDRNVKDIFTTLNVNVWDLKYNPIEGKLYYVKSASESIQL
jgi:hypothetical protein